MNRSSRSRARLGFCTAALLSACGPGLDGFLDDGAGDSPVEASADSKSAAALRLGASVRDVSPAGTPGYLAGRIPTSIHDPGELRDLMRGALASTYRLSPNSDFEVLSERTGSSGDRFVTLRQTHGGVPVTRAQVVVQVAADGAVVAVLGQVLPSLQSSSSAGMGGDAAVRTALNRLAKGTPRVHRAPALHLYHQDGGAPRLTYRAVVEYQGQEGHALEELFVDAQSGAEVARHSLIHTGLSREIFNGKNVCLTTGNELPGTSLFNEGGSSSDATGTAAYTNTGTTYWFYKNFLGRDSYDNAGAKLRSTVHMTFNAGASCTGANAAWLGDPYNQMVYGDGDATMFLPLAQSLDVTAHELTHAVTDKTSGLVYQNESGALNEAMSDIFGAVAEAWSASGGTQAGNPAAITPSANTWKIGEAITRPGSLPGNALRFMNTPTLDNYSKDYYPERLTGSSDSGGVHGNSGIANLAFYLLSQGGKHPRNKTTTQVTAIGIEKAAKIFHLANTSLFTASTNFQAARNATAQAAKTLYGDCGAEYQNTQRAWDAVGVLGTWTCGGGGGDTTPPTVSVSAPTAGATVSGASVTVAASATDNSGTVASVQFYDGATLIGTDTTAPFSLVWDSTKVANGGHSLTAKATDAAGNAATSAAVAVTVNNQGGGTGNTEKEPNDSQSAGNVITSRSSTISGTNKSRTDRDYFIVDLPAGATLSARLTMDANADFDLYVYNSVGSLIASSELSTGLTDTASVRNSSTGTLRRFVEVRYFTSPSSSGSKYQLNLTW